MAGMRSVTVWRLAIIAEAPRARLAVSNRRAIIRGARGGSLTSGRLQRDLSTDIQAGDPVGMFRSDRRRRAEAKWHASSAAAPSPTAPWTTPHLAPAGARAPPGSPDGRRRGARARTHQRGRGARQQVRRPFRLGAQAASEVLIVSAHSRGRDAAEEHRRGAAPPHDTDDQPLITSRRCAVTATWSLPGTSAFAR